MAKVCKRRNRYVLDFYDQHGERQRITMEKGTSKKEAEEELDTYKDQVRKGIYVHDKKVPLFSEVAREWLDFKKPSLRETTWEVCESNRWKLNCSSKSCTSSKPCRVLVQICPYVPEQ